MPLFTLNYSTALRYLPFLLLLGVTPASAAGLQTQPPNMIYLRTLAPEIKQDIRYAGIHNFTGRNIVGYQAAECVMPTPVAEALVRVQAALQPQGYGLKVFDCYRPVRSVGDFKRFALAPGDPTKTEFYPRIDKKDFWHLGYVADKSSHSKGVAVDLTLTSSDALPAAVWTAQTPQVDCAAPYGQRFRDGGVDMGTGFDCFDPRAHTLDPQISSLARINRQRLVDAVAKEGFSNYAGEWWHFSYTKLPQANAMDFPIVPLKGVIP